MASLSASSTSRYDVDVSDKEPKASPAVAVLRRPNAATHHNIRLFLVAYRILNAVTIKTFFQPDEYFQSLEPAWQMSFGPSSGAWITWVSPHFQKLNKKPG